MSNLAVKDHAIPIEELLERPLVSSKDLRENGYNPGLLSYYESKGVVEKVARAHI